jgi:DNA-directed RNA polymerase subunit E'/Rpb7
MRKRTDVAMIEALAWLRDHGLEPDQPTEHQVKFGYVNFYPRKDTVFVDGEICRRNETGLEALAAVLPELGYLR